MAVAVSFNVKKVESTADIIIIWPPMRRAAIAELLAMYESEIAPSHSIYYVPDLLVWEEGEAAHRNLVYKLAC